MPRVYYIVRGYPGLGRVMGACALHQTLEHRWGEAYVGRFASYLAGLRFLAGLPVDAVDLFPDGFYHRPNAYLNPLGYESRLLARDIQAFSPDLVVVDGEPFCVEWLRRLLQRPVLVLANPADFYNPNSDELGIAMFRHYFGHASAILAHGLETLPGVVADTLSAATRLWQIPTIVKPAIFGEHARRRATLAAEPSPARHLACVLGGGTENVHPAFLEATIQIGRWTLQTAARLADARLSVFAGSPIVQERLQLEAAPLGERCELYGELRDATEALITADVVVARSGRNVVSELLALGTRALLVPASAESYRAGEQRRVAELACELGSAVVRGSLETGYSVFERQLVELLERPAAPPDWSPGNSELESLVGEFLPLGRLRRDV